MVARVSHQLSRLGIRTRGLEVKEMLREGRDHLLSAFCGDSSEAGEFRVNKCVYSLQRLI